MLYSCDLHLFTSICGRFDETCIIHGLVLALQVNPDQSNYTSPTVRFTRTTEVKLAIGPSPSTHVIFTQCHNLATDFVINPRSTQFSKGVLITTGLSISYLNVLTGLRPADSKRHRLVKNSKIAT